VDPVLSVTFELRSLCHAWSPVLAHGRHAAMRSRRLFPQSVSFCWLQTPEKPGGPPACCGRQKYRGRNIYMKRYFYHHVDTATELSLHPGRRQRNYQGGPMQPVLFYACTMYGEFQPSYRRSAEERTRDGFFFRGESLLDPSKARGNGRKILPSTAFP
jgi:hypothetical protein